MKKGLSRLSQSFYLFSLVILMSACIPVSPTELPLSTPSETPLPEIMLPSAFPTPTEVVNATPTALDILNLRFPTPPQAPISSWRPPLNDSPWALNPHDHFYFKRPIAADEVNWPLANYRYGATYFGVENIHTGIDIDATRGTPVLAAAPGEVVNAGYGIYLGNGSPNDPYGLAVTIRHNFGFNGKFLYTVYAHMDAITAVKGQWVNTGDQIGIVGNTGNTTGPHLHFEIRLEENSYFWTRNPELWLTPPEGMGILVGTLKNSNGSILTSQGVNVVNRQTGQKWTIFSYGGTTVRSDDYYNENMVLSDLPAGEYEISIDYLENTYRLTTLINSGAITYFSFKGANGFNISPPPTPDAVEWLSPTITPKKK
ncbi:MAG: M23 family metallopeptidase [Anaerolineae bacterium]|nr:M23 family metallopeptidase [Anaerolineae bacterium]